MMGRQSGQLSMMILDLSDLIPNNHLLRESSQVISFDFIYEILEPYYPSNGRPSIDPVSMFKMLLVWCFSCFSLFRRDRGVESDGGPV